MKKILLSVQNNLLSEAIQNALVKKGRFCIENVSPNQDGKILDLCIAERVDVLLMDVTRLADSTIEKRLELCGKVKEYLPSCKTALLCDEQAYPDLLRFRQKLREKQHRYQNALLRLRRAVLQHRQKTSDSSNKKRLQE